MIIIMSAVYNFYFDEANGCQRAIITSGLWSERPTTGLTAGQRYFATDRSIEYAYNATLSKWLSTQIFIGNFSWINYSTPAYFENAINQPPVFGLNRADSRYGMYVESLDLEWSSGTYGSFDSDDGYSATLFAHKASVSTVIATTTLYQVDRASARRRYINIVGINTEFPAGTVVDDTNVVNSFRLVLAPIITGSADNSGDIYGASLRYRLVG